VSVNQIKMPSETFGCVLSHYEHKSKIKKMQILGKKLWQKLEDMWRDAMGLDDLYILFISIMILIKLLQSINYVVLITIFLSVLRIKYFLLPF